MAAETRMTGESRGLEDPADPLQAGDAIAALGAELSGAEARSVATSLEDGETLTQALSAVAPSRQAEVRRLLQASGLGAARRGETVMVLRAIQGARSHTTSLTPVWTLPPGLGALGGVGQLTAATHHLVTAASQSVTVSTFNIQRSSALWEALRKVSGRAGVSVRIYMDADAADRVSRSQGAREWDGHGRASHRGRGPHSRGPTSAQVAAEMPGAVVLRTRRGQDGRCVRNHAKFVAVDGRILIVTSANMSASAEERNVELGLRLDDTLLTRAVEERMRALEPLLYEQVR